MIKNGFSTIEIVIALFVFSLVTASVIIVSFGSQNILMHIHVFQTDLARAQINIEKAKSKAQSHFPEINAEEKHDDFDEQFEVSLIYDYTKKIKSSVHDHHASFRSVDLVAYVSLWSNVVGEDTCFRKLNDPETYEVVSELLIDPDTFLSDIDVVRNTAYITARTSAGPNFFVVDVSDIENPHFLSNTWSTHRRLSSLHVAGKYAFVASESTLRQLQVIDVLEPTAPHLLTELRLPDPSSTTTASTIFYKDKTIFLGTTKHDGGNEFHMIDVSSPATPHVLGFWEADSGVNKISIKKDVAILATPNPVPLNVLDIKNPHRIDLIDSYKTGEESQAGQALAWIDNRVALGRSIGGVPQPTYNELYLFEMGEGGSLNFIVSKRIGASIRDLIMRENFLVLLTTLGAEHYLQFRNTTDNALELVYEIPLSGKPTALDCEDDRLFVVTEAPNAKLIIIAPTK